MNRLFRQLVAILLVPCLIGNTLLPVGAANYANRETAAPAMTDCFTRQAVNAPVIFFARVTKILNPRFRSRVYRMTENAVRGLQQAVNPPYILFPRTTQSLRRITHSPLFRKLRI